MKIWEGGLIKDMWVEVKKYCDVVWQKNMHTVVGEKEIIVPL